MEKLLSDIISHFPLSGVTAIEPLGNGRMHATYRVEAAEGRFVLQKLGEAIPSSVVTDIRKVTEHLSQHGILAQRIVPCLDDSSVLEADGERWRLMNYLDGIVVERDPTQSQAESAAAFLARFHTALLDYEAPFSQQLPQILNPARAFSELERVLLEFAGTEKDAKCRELAQSIQEAVPTAPQARTRRVLHGDPKLANFIFDEPGEIAIALIDLDTVGRYPLPLEMGDMLRSFCMKRNGDQVTFDAKIWHASLRGYCTEALFLSDQERLGISQGFETVTLALAARYLADAYEEKYFAHDPHYPTLFEQNLARARLNFALVEDFRAKTQSGELAEIN